MGTLAGPFVTLRILWLGDTRRSPIQIVPHGIQLLRLGHDDDIRRAQGWMQLGCVLGTDA